MNRTRHDEILSVGSIESDGTTYIEGKNYISEAGIVSGKTTVINAQENITIGSMTLQGDDKFGSDNNNYQAYQSTRKIGSEISGTEAVILEAGKDITVKGSVIGSDGLIQMTAENINILNEKESEYKERKEKSGNAVSNYSMEEKSYQEYAAASTIIGNNIILDASNDINVKTSNIIAIKEGSENTGGNISMTAGNNVNILVDTLDNSYSFKEKKSGFSTNIASGGGSFTAGVSYSQTSLEQERNGTTVAVSTIISEGNTVIDAGNRVRTEAMQANIGENLVIRGVNGVELLDAQEVFQEKVKQESTSIGLSVSVGSTVTSFIDQANNMYNDKDKYGTTNTSELINSAGDGFTLYRSGVSAFNDAQSIYDKLATGIHPANALAGITANVSLSFSQSSYESNTNGTTSVAGNINVGENFIIESDGDVRLINQKVNVGENFIVDAKNFEARAGENTYSNNTKSRSSGGSVGYDVAQRTMTGGVNVSGGKSNTDSRYYDNTVINVGGIFQLTTKEDALFAGVNVTADKINFDIGRDLSIISLQDEYKSDGKNYGAGIGYSEKDPTTNEVMIGSLTGNVSYNQNNAESKWVSNQTSIIAENGGNIKVGETLTNIGSIIGSLNADEKLSIEANKVVVSNLEDYNRGENAGVNVGGIGFNNKAPIGQTGVQYGSHDKEQDTNATFVNTEVTEAGKKLNLEELGINTDINKAQIVTKDEVVEQIDTNLHTDMLNTTTRQQFMEDTRKAGHGILDIIDSAGRDNLRYEEARTDRYAQYYIEKNPQMAEFIKDPDSKSAADIEKLTKDYIKYMTGKDVEVVLVATGDGSGYIRGDQNGESKKDVLILDVTDLASGLGVANLYGHEPNHVDDHRRGRDAGDEITSDAAGDRLSEILGENGKSNKFDLSKWLNDDENLQALATGREHIVTEYEGYEIEHKKIDNTKCVPLGVPECYKQYMPDSTFKEIMDKTTGKTFAPFEGIGDSLNNIKIVNDEKPNKNTPINYGDKPTVNNGKTVPVPKSIIEYTSDGAKLVQEEVNKLNKGFDEWYISLDFNEIDNSINYAFSGAAQFGEGWVTSGNPYLFFPGLALMIPETGKDVGDLLVGLYEKDYGKSLTFIGAIAITGTESVMLVDNYKQAKKYYSTYKERLAQTPINNGEWTGERGESTFISTKPSVQKILKDLGQEGISYTDAVPDFNPVSKHKVEIEGMSTSRYKNFKLADEELAKQLNIPKNEVEAMRRQFKLTWHEDNDTKTMFLVPTEINQKFGHYGGVGEIKKMLEGSNKK